MTRLRAASVLLTSLLIAGVASGSLFAQPTGVTLEYSTYLGGTSDDQGQSIAVDSAGSSLVYSTYLGGNQGEGGGKISVDSALCAYVAGTTYSSDFPQLGGYQTSRGGLGDATLTKFDSTGSSLVFSSFLGGSNYDGASGLAVNPSGATVVTGYVRSTNFPVLNPYQSSHAGGTNDIFVTFFTSSGSAITYSTYLGGSGANDFAKDIILNPSSAAVITGYTDSTNFPIVNSYQSTSAGGNEAFLTKFSTTGSTLDYSTYLGGDATDLGYGLGLTSDGSVYVGGATYSENFPTVDAYQAAHANPGTPNYDAFIARFGSTGSTLEYSTFWGGSGNDVATTLDLDQDEAVHITGYTDSEDFPTFNPYQAGYAGGTYDAFLSRFAPQTPIPTPSVQPTPSQTPTVTPSPTTTPTVTPTPPVIPTPPTTPTPILPPTPSPTPTCGPPVPLELQAYRSGDYDGDGTAEIAIFRPTSGLWAIRGLTRFTFGSAASRVVSADYDGDGTADAAVFNPASALWAIRNLTRIYYGSAGDLPAPGDYNGSGTVAPGIFREASGLWAIRGMARAYFGAAGDRPIPGDYDGDGVDDIAVYRPDAGGSGFSLFAILNVERDYYGRPGDWPVPMDYDGDGAVDMGIFRATTNAVWAVRDVTRRYYGRCVDWPAAADYDGDGVADLGIFRDSAGLWAVRGVTRAYFGADGDVPITR